MLNTKYNIEPVDISNSKILKEVNSLHLLNANNEILNLSNEISLLKRDLFEK